MEEKVAGALNPIPEDVTRLLHTAGGSEWSLRWQVISAIKLSRPIRSFLWRFTHRRLVLLGQAWSANHHQLLPHCILCEQQQKETYSHLFSDCPMATNLWNLVLPLQALLVEDADVGGDQRPARLLGDLSQFTRQWSSPNTWPAGSQPPPLDRVTKMVREIWTEVRGIVLHATWVARCDLLHGSVASKEAAATQATARGVKSTLRTVAYRKLPSLLPGAKHPPPGSKEQLFNTITWGAMPDPLLLPRHHPNLP